MKQIFLLSVLSCNNNENPIFLNQKFLQKDGLDGTFTANLGYMIIQNINYYAPGSSTPSGTSYVLDSRSQSFYDDGYSSENNFTTYPSSWYDRDGGYYQHKDFEVIIYADWQDSPSNNETMLWQITDGITFQKAYTLSTGSGVHYLPNTTIYDRNLYFEPVSGISTNTTYQDRFGVQCFNCPK